jgi:L-alanine-DL-glutamate epimerase-like enolase superfamily enzyme
VKITEIECIPLTLPGVGKWNNYQTVLIKIHTDEGITGIAECGGTMAWSSVYGDSQEHHMALINENFGPNILLGEDPRNIAKIIGKMAKAAFSRQTIELIDFALYDIAGKKQGAPAYQVLGGLCNEKIKTHYVLSYDKTEEVSAKATGALKAGYGAVKLKVAREDLERDIANLEAVRKVVGPDIKIGIDGNGGWDYYSALMAIKELEKYDIRFVEQPLPWWDIDGMSLLRRKINVPLSADESAYQPQQVLQLIRREAVDFLFLKITKAGGLYLAQQWIAIARAADLPVMVGCMVGTGIECAAQAQLLASNEWTGVIDFGHGNNAPLHRHGIFDTKEPVTGDLAKNVPRFEDGYLYPPTGPGLGVELNEELAQEWITPGKQPTVIKL